MENNNIFQQMIEGVMNKGVTFLEDALGLLFNAAMKIEREIFLGAKSYERSEERKGYANGYKPKILYLRSGKITLAIPQVRDLEFYPSCIEKGERSEKALKLALAQMYISGISTRKVKEVTEILCGTQVSSTQVSGVAKLLDEEFAAFRNRELGQFVYVTLDATYLKVRVDKQVVSQCLMLAIGVNTQGHREVIGIDVKSSEATVNWTEFLESLSARGLAGVQMFTSDAHTGLKKALNKVFPGTKWQRCQFHFAQDAQHKATNQDQKTEIGHAVSSIFNQTTLEAAEDQVQKVLAQFNSRNNKFASWLEENVHEVLTVYSQPEDLRIKIRTSNHLERTNREIKKRTSLVGIFPNTESLLRLATAVLVEIHENWSVASQPFMHLSKHKELLIVN